MLSRSLQLRLQLSGIGRIDSPRRELELISRQLSSESIVCWTSSVEVQQQGQPLEVALEWPERWTQGRPAVLEARGAVVSLQPQATGTQFSVGLQGLPALRFKDDGSPAHPPAILQPLDINLQAFDYYARLRRVLDHLQQNLGEPLSLVEAAELAGMEPTYFSDFFKRKVGVPFRRWMEHLRIGYVLDLIHSRNHSITHIAHEAGFGSLRSLERAFKRRTRLTPTQYKETVRPS